MKFSFNFQLLKVLHYCHVHVHGWLDPVLLQIWRRLLQKRLILLKTAQENYQFIPEWSEFFDQRKLSDANVDLLGDLLVFWEHSKDHLLRCLVKDLEHLGGSFGQEVRQHMFLGGQDVVVYNQTLLVGWSKDQNDKISWCLPVTLASPMNPMNYTFSSNMPAVMSYRLTVWKTVTYLSKP